jgi:YHYH protein
MNSHHLRSLTFVLSAFTGTAALAADPRLASWFTERSGHYARVHLTDADRLAGNAVATWSRGAISQALPAYCGVHEVASSANWAYVRTTGLGSHTMGPWYGDAAHANLFMNVPKSSATLFRISRAPTVPATKTLTGLGPIGVFVDGVIMFDSRDAFAVSAPSGTEANPGLGIWNRDAFVNEGVTFDPANAHQPSSGLYHYHANAIALRALLDDNVNFDPVTRLYSENTANAAPAHSPILGWVRDGFPVYGPYGFASSNNPASGVRRMISGFVPRNLATAAVSNRTTLPVWAGRAQNRSTTLAAAQFGPAVSTARPFGRYLEDNDYLGDLGFAQGTHFDLDEFNGRFCVTPEFPDGTYAYFTAISSNGTPVFPYHIGRQYYGNPSGGVVMGGVYPEAVTTNFLGGANSSLRVQAPAVAASDVTLTWSGAEGGTYVLVTSTNLPAWTTNASSITATSRVTRATEVGGAAGRPQRFYRVQRTGLAPYAN